MDHHWKDLPDVAGFIDEVRRGLMISVLRDPFDVRNQFESWLRVEVFQEFGM